MVVKWPRVFSVRRTCVRSPRQTLSEVWVQTDWDIWDEKDNRVRRTKPLYLLCKILLKFNKGVRFTYSHCGYHFGGLYNLLGKTTFYYIRVPSENPSSVRRKGKVVGVTGRVSVRVCNWGRHKGIVTTQGRRGLVKCIIWKEGWDLDG